MVSVTEALCEGSATEIAETVAVCTELVAAGAVKIAEEVVLARLPAPLCVQVTPALFGSLATVAVSVTLFAGSTVAAVGDTVTLTGLELLPPQPDRHTPRTTATLVNTSLFENINAPTKWNYFDESNSIPER
jgi:hypothetical protein